MTETRKVLSWALKRALAQLPFFPQALHLVWTAARGWTLAWCLMLVLQGLLPIAVVYLMRATVDSLTGAMANGNAIQNIVPTLVLIACLAGVMLLLELLQNASNWIRTAQTELVKDHISALIHAKSIAVDLAFYEMPEYYDQLYRARDEANFRPVALLENLGGFFQNGITLVAMAAVLIPYGLWLPGALLVSTLPALFIVFHYAVREHEWRMKTTVDQRRSWYYDRLLTTGEAAAELRLFELGTYFENIYQTLRRRLRSECLSMAKEQTIAKLGAGILALSIGGAVMAWMILRALHGQATLGDLVLFYQAFSQGQSLMRSLLLNVGQVYSNSMFLGNLFDFLALEPHVVDPVHPQPAPKALKNGIAFKGVTFCYPNSQRIVLQPLDLFLPIGQLTAILGPNGAGKSTLVKLLCRLYDPDTGCIQIDGTDLRELSVSEWRRLVTVLPQQYTHYNVEASQNIALGDLRGRPDRERIKAAARDAMADEIIRKLPKGYDTLLGTWLEGGTELSVGEYQRIALARALVRPGSIILLDEPTSAMDPWAETEWLGKLREIAAGRIAVIITHRLTTAMACDTIHVMNAGQVVESGNHAQLLEANGLYSRLWNGQRAVSPQEHLADHFPIQLCQPSPSAPIALR